MMIQLEKKQKSLFLIVAILFIAALSAWGAYQAMEMGLMQQMVSLIKNNAVSPPVFIALTLILPAIGMPMSVFLLFGSVTFGAIPTTLLWFFVLPLHATIGYYVARFLHPYLVRFFIRTMGYTMPQIPRDQTASFSFLFYAIPGIPYAGKNYLLPLAGVPLRYCVVMNTVVQGIIGLPFIILGESAAMMDKTMLYGALGVFFLIYLAGRWLKKRYGTTLEKKK